ncbi:biopolymer transporter ExbD [Parvibaculum sp.]|jgi:biopolymer transport protein ExbD|uniref:ExbD/TolR family protein n=1 Tax=Parvibaculum sp. TaxID=2024848 RepID=UPI0032968693
MIDFDEEPPRRQFETLVPLINVVFLLLIFFLLAGTMQPSENIAVSLPEGALNDREKDVPTTLIVEADGFIWLGDRVMDAKLSGVMMEKHLKDSNTKRVAIKADANAPADAVLELMEGLREAGVEQVTIMTERGS